MTEICTASLLQEEKRKSSGKIVGCKMHCVYIALKIRNKFILFLPALIPLFSEKGSISSQLLASFLIQLAALSLVLIPAVISRHYMCWQYDGKFITLRQGVLHKTETALPLCNVRSVAVIKTPLLSLFKAVRLEIRSSDGRKKPEITLFLSRDEADRLVASVIRPKKALQTLIPRTLPFILTSASRSDFISGLALLAVFIISAGSSVSALSPDRLYSGFSDAAVSVMPYLPPVLAVLSGLLLLGRIIHFLNICFSDARQITTISQDNIFIVRGLISTTLVCLRKDGISACHFRKTALTALFGQGTIFMNAPGQPRNKPLCALTAWPHSDFGNAAMDLCALEEKCDISVKVPDNARLVWWLPYGCLSLLSALLFIKDFISKEMTVSSLSLIFISGFILSVWKCLMGMIGSGKSGIEFSGQNITISSVRFFSFYTEKIFMGCISELRITSTLLQRHRRLCTVSIKAVGSDMSLKCRNLPFDTVNVLSERIK